MSYQDLYNLSKLIEEKEEELKLHKANYQDSIKTNKTAIDSGDLKPNSALNNTNIVNKQQLNNALDELTKLYEQHKNLTTDIIPKFTVEQAGTELYDNKDAFKVNEDGSSELNPQYTLQNYVEDNRHNFPNMSDSQILNFLNVTRPDDIQTILSANIKASPQEELNKQYEELGFGGGIFQNTKMNFLQSKLFYEPASTLLSLDFAGLTELEAEESFKNVVLDSGFFTDSVFNEEEADVMWKEFLKSGYEADSYIASEYIKKGIEYGEQFYKDNPLIQAKLESINGKTMKELYDSGELMTYINNFAQQTSISVGQILSKQYLGKIAGGSLGALLGTAYSALSFGPDPLDAAVITETSRKGALLGQALFSGVAGYNLEHASYLANAVSNLVQPMELKPEELSELIRIKNAEYTKEIKKIKEERGSENFKPDFQIAEEMVKDYLRLNVIRTDDGRIFTRPLNPYDAVIAAEYSAVAHGLSASLIEQISLFPKGFREAITPNIIREKFYNRFSNKFANKIKDIPVINKIRNIGKGIDINPNDSFLSTLPARTFNTFVVQNNSEMMSEGFEEVLTSVNQNLIDVYGPAFQREYKWDPRGDFSSRFSWRGTVFEPLAGGALGSKMFQIAGMNQDNSSIANRLGNLSVVNQLNNLDNGGVVVKETEDGAYKLYNKVISLDENNNEVINEVELNSKDPRTLEDIQTEYPDFQSANEAAMDFNVYNKEEGEKRVAWANKWLVGAETKLEQYDNEAGFPVWRVVVVNKNDEVIKVITDNKKQKYEANREKTKIDKNIDSINKIVDKYGIEEIDKSNEDVISSIGNLEELDKQNSTTPYEDGYNWVEQNKKVFSYKDAKILVKGFMEGYKNEDTNHTVSVDNLNTQDSSTLEKMEEDGLVINPEVIVENIKEYPELLQDEEIQVPIDVFKQNFQESFFGQEGVEDYLAIIEESLSRPYNSEVNTDDTEINIPELERDIEAFDASTPEITDSDEFTDEVQAEFDAQETEETIIKPTTVPEPSKTEEVDGYIKVKYEPAKHVLSSTPEGQQLNYVENILHPEGKPELFEEGYVWEKAPEKPITVKQYIPEDKPEKPDDKRAEVKIDEETYDKDIAITESEEILTVEQADEILADLEEYKISLIKKDREEGTPEIQNELSDIRKAEDEILQKRSEIKLEDFSKRSEEAGIKADDTVEERLDKLGVKKDELKDEEVVDKTRVKTSNIIKNRSDKLVPTKQQSEALTKIDKEVLIENPDDPNTTDDNIFVFSGYAGTGKTTIVENIARQANDKGYNKIVLSSFTNTAVRRIEDKNQPIKNIAEFSTLHKFLYGPPNKITGRFELKTAKQFADTGFTPDKKTLIVVDEASMIDIKLRDDLNKIIDTYGSRVIYIGDGFQLKPVGDDPRIMENTDYQMTDVQRQKAGGVLTLATAIRNDNMKSVLNKKGYSGALMPVEDVDNVKISKPVDFRREFETMVRLDALSGEDNTVAVTYTNKTRESWNRLARDARYERKSINPLNKNERLIALSNNDDYSNGDQFILKEPKLISSHKVRLQTSYDAQTKTPITTTVDAHIFEDNEGRLGLLFPTTIGRAAIPQSIVVGGDAGFRQYLDPTSKRPKLRQQISTFTYGYAVTGHKVQGMEYPNVFVVADDLAYMRNRDTGIADKELQARWFYTAITRTQDRLFIQDTPIVTKVETKELEDIAFQKISKKQMLIASGQAEVQPERIQERTKKIAKMLFDKFEGAIELEFTDNISDDITNYKGNIAAYYDKVDKKVTINTALATPDAGFHEFMHPFITEIREMNPALYNNILEELSESVLGQEKLNNIVETYQNDEKRPGFIDEYNKLVHEADGYNLFPKDIVKLLNKFDSKDKEISDELIAHSISDVAENIHKKRDNVFMRAIQRFFDWLKSKLFGNSWTTNIYARSLNPDTSFKEVARLLANSNRRFTLEKVDAAILKEQFDFRPTDRFQLMAYVEKEQELTMSDELSRDKAWLKDFFNRMWDISKPLKKQTRKEDFFNIMDSSLRAEVKETFYTWYRGKFNIKKPVGDNSTPIGQNSIYDEMFEQLEENEETMFDISRRMGLVNTNEKVLPSHNLTFIKDFGVTLLQQDLNRMIVLSKRDAFNTFDKWLPKALKIIKYRGALPQWKKEGMIKFYNRIRSMERTNNKEMSGIKNYEVQINTDGSFSIELMGPERKFLANNDKSRSNPGFQKKTLADFLPTVKGLFNWFSKKNMRKRTIFANGMMINNNVLYNFLNQQELESLDNYLIKNHGKVIAFSRGNSPKLAIVDIKQEHKNIAKTNKSVTDYLSKEVSEERMTSSQARELMKLFATSDYKNNATNRAAEIAVHEGMKEVWPKYLMDKKGGPNVYKRLKIPFTPVTVNENMDNLIAYYFNPSQVLFQYKDREPFSPMQKVSGKSKQYIGDGETMTSKDTFNVKLNKGHGLRKGTNVAKTVQYMMDGINTYALKHQHQRVEPGLKILNKKREVLFRVNDSGNLVLGEAHPDYKAGKRNYLDFLATSDEIKIGSENNGMLFDKDGKLLNNGKLVIPGVSVGFIKFEEGSTPHAKHIQQVYNFVDNPVIINNFKDNYLPIVEKKIREVIRLASDTKGGKTAAEKIAKKLEDIHGVDEIGFIPHILELARLGAGFHQQTGKLIDQLVQGHLIEPALTLSGKNGSVYNVSMDATNTLKPKEISISRHKASYIFNKYKEANNITAPNSEITNDEINQWLLNNEVYGMVTRSPVANEGGTYMGRVKFLHEREAVVMMNIEDIKNRIEGDADGDHVEIEFLPTDQMTLDYVNHFNNLEIRDLNLDDFVNEKLKYFLLSRKGRAGLINRLISGEMAIGEIANASSVYGIINKFYESFESKEIMGRNIILKGRQDKVYLNVPYKNKQGWTGTVDEFLRLMLQASVDNSKYGLLGQWGYENDSFIWTRIFTYEDGSDISQTGKDYDEVIQPLVRLHIQANRIRNGYEFGSQFAFRDVLKKSGIYKSYIMNRQKYLSDNLKIISKLKTRNIGSIELAPIEMIAIAPSEILEEMTSVAKYNLMGYDASPFIVNDMVHMNSHVSSMNELDRLKEFYLNKAYDKDNLLSVERKQEERQKGLNYAIKMSNEWKKRRDEYNAKGPQSVDRNDKMIEWKEQYDAMFDGLSNTAQVTATYYFLEGQISKERWGFSMPPVSDRKDQASMLDPEIVKNYFKLYNEQVRDLNNNDKKLKQEKYRILERIIKEDC